MGGEGGGMGAKARKDSGLRWKFDMYGKLSAGKTKQFIFCGQGAFSNAIIFFPISRMSASLTSVSRNAILPPPPAPTGTRTQSPQL